MASDSAILRHILPPSCLGLSALYSHISATTLYICPVGMSWVSPAAVAPRSSSHASSRGLSRRRSSGAPAIELMSVRLSRQAYGDARTAVVFLRLVNIAFYAAFACVYWYYPQTETAIYLSIYTNLLPLRFFLAVAVIHVAFAVAHTVMMFRHLRRTKHAFHTTSFRESRLQSAIPVLPESSKPRTIVVIWRRLGGVLIRINSMRLRVFGVRSEYFETMFLAREVLEALLQTIQAYKMDSLQPRMWLNRLFVSVLVLNCWATPLLYVLLPTQQPLRRLLCLVSDYLMDLISTVIVPTLLGVTYVSYYDSETGSIDTSLWYNDAWFVNMVNESQLVLISSSTDALSRLMFSINLLVSLESITALIRPAVQSTDNAKASLLLHHSESQQPIKAAQASHMHSGRIHHAIHWIMVAWGFVVLVLHVHAELRPNPAMCVLQVHPWATTTPSCALLRIVCDDATAASSENVVDVTLAGLERKWLTHLVVDSCPQLVIPARLNEFHSLLGLRITNSTIIQWDQDAALTQTRQPSLRFAYFARVDFVNASLPPGLLSPNFPPTLQDLEFCMTNLASIPDNVSAIWPDRLLLLLEYTQLTVVPAVLTRMHLLSLSLVGSPVREIPAELFMSTTLHDLSLSATAIQSLPASVKPSLVSLRILGLDWTNISALPDWLDETFATTVAVSAGVSPFCLVRDSFDAPQGRAMLDASPWLRKIFCMPVAPTEITLYPLFS